MLTSTVCIQSRGIHLPFTVCNDMGTYDYIVKRREEENRMELEEAEHREVKERGGCCQVFVRNQCQDLCEAVTMVTSTIW